MDLKEIKEEEELITENGLEWNHYALGENKKNITDYKTNINIEFKRLDNMLSNNNLAIQDYIKVKSRLIELNI